jgi:hypothetical protein
MAAKYSAADYTFQFVTVTVGMFIALFINGMVEWNRDRRLVAEARATLVREITDNRKDLQTTLVNIPRDREAMLNAIRFADDMLAAGKTNVTALNLHYNLADLYDTSWRTAERTGALSHMEYAEVQRYSKVYDFQDLFVQQQRNILTMLSSASALISENFDPDKPNLKDLEVFRDRVMQLRAAITVQESLAKRLDELYAEALK